MKSKTPYAKFVLALFISLFVLTIHAQLPSPALVGYWHNWNSSKAPYFPLDMVDSRYNVVNVAFGVPINGTDFQIGFTPYAVSQAVFVRQIDTLQAQGRKVLLSLGGGGTLVRLDNIAERDVFVSSVSALLTAYGFDGIDIDFEGNSLTVTGGTIAAPIDEPVIHLIDAIKTIMSNYRAVHGKKLLLTMAPETAYVQGGQSSWGGIFRRGSYLPVIHALRDSLDLLFVQLYNSGSMYGIDGGIYFQGTADFIVAMTEATIQGFKVDRLTNQHGPFIGLPQSKIAIALPACPNAASGGFTNTATVQRAMDYLLGKGPKPGAYTLVKEGGYPNLGGMMTWSLNWDRVTTCNATTGEYATNFLQIFLGAPSMELNYFFADIIPPGQVKLEWETALEINNDYFEVERSPDNKSWQTLERIEAKGNTIVPTYYTIMDMSPIPGLNYYRLKLTDFDKRYNYSPVLEVTVSPVVDATVLSANTAHPCIAYPNPVRGQLRFKNDCGMLVSRIELFNALGQRVYKSDVLMDDMLSVANLPSGVYFLTIHDKSGKRFTQVIRVVE